MNLQSIINRISATDLLVAVVFIRDDKVCEKPWDFTDDTGKQRNGVTLWQNARVEHDGFAYPFKVKLENKADAYPAGEYIIDLASMLTFNKEAMFLTKFHKLVPVKPAAPATKVA